MSDDNKLKVVLCWHMHQPEYRDLITGRYHLPWTYLHTIKDYVDMAALLEAQPGARAVINFVPILLEQIADYAVQVQGYLNGRMAISDPLLAALDAPVLPVRMDDRTTLIRNCLKINKATLIDRFPAYKRLVDIAEWMSAKPEAVIYLGEQYLVDLLVWYHLAWLGETVRRSDERVKRLIAKGGAFTLQERRQVMVIIGELLSTILDRYRALAQEGRVELSMTPYGHPIAPLLMDFATAREAAPDLALPQAKGYPGGDERVRWHIAEGIKTFTRHFGTAPRGCWPAEGGINTGFARMLGELGFEWTASGGNVLHNSLNRYRSKPDAEGHALYRPYRLDGGKSPACFFRDDGLSDLIGFTYSNWHADDAVNNLVHNLETIAGTCKRDGHDCVVSIILDGENAWEHYPENGYHFLSGLYARLSDHPNLCMATFSSCLDQGIAAEGRLPALVGGSWVYGTFTTWIGDKDKNRGWDLLCAAKRVYDAALASGRLSTDQIAAATQQLAVCEGSDWFWWFGDYNPAAAVSEFEHLYRLHIGNLYQILGEPAPDNLAEVISAGGGQPVHGGTMRPGQAVLP